MPTVKLELESDIYANLVKCGVDIETEFKKFLLQKNLSRNDKVEEREDKENIPFTNYWDALDAEIKSIKILNSKIFN